MMDPKLAIEQLKRLVVQGGSPEIESDTPSHTTWRANSEAILRRALPSDSLLVARFSSLQYHLLYSSSSLRTTMHFKETTQNAVALLQAAIFELELAIGENSASVVARSFAEAISPDVEVSPKVVFVVHGRNIAAKDAMFEFLSSIGLSPVEWDEAIKWTGNGTPYVGEIIEAGLSRAQAVVVLMTPDEVTYLNKAYASGEDDEDTRPEAQVRPNVLFEAGMAMGRKPKYTILVQLGEMRSFSDVHGRHVIRLSNNVDMRRSLALRLETVGCEIDMSTESWKTAGNFEIPQATDAGLQLGRRYISNQEKRKIDLDARA